MYILQLCRNDAIFVVYRPAIILRYFSARAFHFRSAPSNVYTVIARQNTVLGPHNVIIVDKRRPESHSVGHFRRALRANSNKMLRLRTHNIVHDETIAPFERSVTARTPNSCIIICTRFKTQFLRCYTADVLRRLKPYCSFTTRSYPRIS